MKYLVDQGKCSERRACILARISRSVVRYVAKEPRDERELIRKIHELAVRHSRYGYRREGLKVNRKRVHRIWKAEGLSLPMKRPRRRRVRSSG